MLDASYYASLGLADVLDKVLAGQRLSAEDGMALSPAPTSPPWAPWPTMRVAACTGTRPRMWSTAK